MQDLAFLRRQFGQLVRRAAARRCADPLQNLLGHRWIEERFAARDRLQRRDEVAAADLLQKVPGSAGDDGGQDGLLVRVAGQHHDARLGSCGPDFAAGLDAGAVGQPDIHHHEVRLEARGLGDGLGHGAGLGDDVEALATIEERDETLAHDLVVIHDEEREGPFSPFRSLIPDRPPVGRSVVGR